MTKSLNLKQIQKQTSKLVKRWQKKWQSLSRLTSRFGAQGASIWLKSHHQLEQFEAAINELLIASEQEDFSLLQVDTTLSSFILPEEDLAQAEWYRAAHCYLQEFEDLLQEKRLFDLKKLQAAQNELKFISQSNEFHQRYGIESIQQKVTDVYQSLQQTILDYKTAQQEEVKLQKEKGELKAKKFAAKKAEAEAKTAMMENIKVKENRLLIIEQKKKRIAEKELLEAQSKKQLEQAELQAQNAEQERQAKLQDAYIDLQLEEKIAQWTLDDFIDLFSKKLSQQSLNGFQQEKLKTLLNTENS